jgi:hypothetical protein
MHLLDGDFLRPHRVSFRLFLGVVVHIEGSQFALRNQKMIVTSKAASKDNGIG